MEIFGEFELLTISAGIIILLFILINSFFGGLFLFKKYRAWKKSKDNNKENSNENNEDEEKNTMETEKKNFIAKLKYFFGNFGLLIFNIILVLCFLAIMHMMFFPSPRVERTYPNSSNEWVEDRRPIEIEFDRPIREGVLETFMNSDTKGTWVYEKSFSFLPFIRVVKFYPDETFAAGEEHIIYLVNFDQRDVGEYEFKFRTAEMPEIEAVSPTDNEENVQIDREIDIKLDNPNGRFVEWGFKIKPTVEYETNYIDDQNIQLVIDGDLKQTKKYTLEIFRTPQTYSYEEDRVVRKKQTHKIHETYFTTVKAPLIESYSPQDSGVRVDEDIVIVFDTDMKKEQVENAFKIEPEIEGTFSWDDNRTVRFTPTNQLEKGTKYKVTLAAGLMDSNGGITESEIIIEFETVGKVKVISFNPSNGSQERGIDSNIFVTFDQPVDHASAQSKFSIDPNVEGIFGWDGNTLVFNPNTNLAYETNYTISIAPGVKTVYGIDSDQAFSSSFTTQNESFILNMVSFGQSYSKGCNVTSLAMILSYKGTPSSESSVIAGVGTQPYKGSGGNPHLGWVPDYGVYGEPLRAYAQSLGYSNTTYGTGWSLTSILNEVKNGNPVLIWAQNGNSNPNFPTVNSYSWTASNGQNIYAVNGMHSYVVVGYDGSPENPTGIYLRDTYWYGGGVQRVSTSYFLYLWENWDHPGGWAAPSPSPASAGLNRAALVVK